MCKLCIFLVYNNNPEAFGQTVKSLKQAVDFEKTMLIIIFESFLYELDSLVLQTVDNLSIQNVKCLYNVKQNILAQRIIEEIPDDGFFFFIREGDVIDPDYLMYINYFFEDNSGRCNVLLTPVVKPDEKQLPKNFMALPYNGIKLLEKASGEILPTFMEGVVLSGELFRNILIGVNDGMDIFYEVLLKEIMQQNSYGIINTVTYISDKKTQSCISTKLLIKIADYALNLYAEIPRYLIDLMDVYVSEQLNNAIDNFDKDIFLLREYLPSAFDEIDNCSFSLCVTDIRNYYADVEIIGTYTRPHWETETKLLISSPNHIEIIYEEKPGNSNQWKQEMHFKAIAQLNRDNITLQFGLHTVKGFEFVETVSFAALGEGTGRISNYTVSRENSKIHIRKIAPRAYYKVSCIIPVFNGAEYIEETIKSVISQSIDFFAHIQILLVNNGSTDDTESICLGYESKYPYNVSYFYLEESGVSKARNHGLQYAVGEYISFLDADDKLPPDYMEIGTKYLDSTKENIDMVAFPIEYFGKNDRLPKSRLNFRFTGKTVVNVSEKPNYIHFSICSMLVRKSVLDDILFNEALSYSEDAEFVHKIILNTMQYGIVDKPAYLYRIRENGFSATQSKKSQINWYMKNTVFGKALIEYSLAKHGCVTQYTQNLIVHELSDNLVTDIPDDIAKQVDIESIMKAISESLQYVEDDVIKTFDTLDYWFRCFLLKLKHGSTELKRQGSLLEFYIGGKKFEPLKPKTYITEIREKDNRFYVSGFYNLASYDGIELVSLYNGHVYSAVITDNRHKAIYFLGEAVHKAKIFDFEIPITEEGIVDFYIQIKGETDYPVELVFPYNASTGNASSFFVGENTLILATSKSNQLKLERRTGKGLSEMISNSLKPFSKAKFNADKLILAEYLSMYPIMSASRIWLFMDEPKSANGNAEVMFDFCSNLKDGIENIFVIDKNTIDGVRLENAGTVIQYGSAMHKLLYLYAEKVFVSNVLDNSYNPFADSGLYSIYMSIVRAEIVYLPNEPQTEDLSARINRFTRNISLYATVSDMERELVLNNAYGYGANVVQAVGLPKYDRLIDRKQKRIIFMPSWRESLYSGDNVFNFDFTNSEYCKKISELLCDERLFEVMTEYDYEMCFAPHERTYLQLADFDMYENVNVISPSFPRQDLFISGDLLITDWMPVFEFAYMKKPVIYYRFAEEVTETVPDCDVNFGETATDNETLVDRLIYYIQNDCIIPIEYAQQADKYFKYTDNNNCERIYAMVKDSR